MKISDELRELADRIDDEMTELPKDRDGEVIHVGDMVYRDDVGKLEVRGINLMRHAVTVECKGQDGETYVFLGGLSHDRPDSLERIADEMKNAVGCAETSARGDEAPWVFAASVEKWAERLRKLAKEASDETD